MLDVVRKACLPAIWSQGVKLAREGAVSRTSEGGQAGAREMTFRVRAASLRGRAHGHALPRRRGVVV